MSEREVIMHSTPFLDEAGNCKTPYCCGVKMQDDGGCSEGCCDDYRCDVCGKRIRIEWPD